MEITFILLYIVVLLLSGLSLMKIYDNKSTTNYIALGFVLHVGLIELFCWWMVAFHFPMKLFVVISSVLIVALSLMGVKHVFNNVSNLLCKHSCIKWYQLVLLGIIIYECTQLIIFYRSDADDSFYVSNVLLFSKSEFLNLYDSSFGNSNLGTVPMYDFQIWESYLAFFCKLFSIKATVMCHYIMPLVLLLVAISAELCLGEELFNEASKKYIFVSILQIFYMWGGYAVYSKGSFLFSRLWQGKAVYLHVTLPLVLTVILHYTKEIREKHNTHVDKRLMIEWSVVLLLLMLSGVALNPTSMYVIGFQMFFMLVAVAICQKEWKYILSGIPAVGTIVFYSCMILIRTKENGGQIEAASSIPDKFSLSTLLAFFGEGKIYFVIYIVCAIFILCKGTFQAKIICVYTPILLLIGVWNPIMAPVVAKNLTMVPSFWRVYWLIPVDYAIAYVISNFTEKKIKYVLIDMVLVLCIFFFGNYMFSSNNNFVRAENKERVSTDILRFGTLISEDYGGTVLCCDYAATTLRQEYVDIELMVSRYQYILDLFMYRGNQQEAEERIILFNFINGNMDNSNIENIDLLLVKYNVKWIIINSDNITAKEYLRGVGYDMIDESEHRLLLKR